MYRGYIGIMEKKMEGTISGLGLGVRCIPDPVIATTRDNTDYTTLLSYSY